MSILCLSSSKTGKISSKYNINGIGNDVREEKTDHDEDEKEDRDEDDTLMDPKLKEAIEKMQKLDRILAKKVKKEKDVKRQRLLLEQKLLEELERAKPEGRDETKESAENTTKFLALKPPPKHYEGILTEEEEVCFSPLFATQPIDLKDGQSQYSDATSEGASTSRSTSTGKFSTNSRQTSGSNKKRNNSKDRKGKKTKKNCADPKDETNFIQRNIQLASDASNVIAMTDDEKRRLEDLLADVEMLGDGDDNKQNDENLHTLQLHSVPGIGYHPDQTDMQALKDIDEKLKELMPAEDFESICSTPREINIHPSVALTHISDLRESLDVMELGEKVLQENQDMRNQQEKLKNIEKELVKLQNRVEMEIISPRMSKAQLSELYEEFTDVSSRATSETNSIALSSPRTPHGAVSSPRTPHGFNSQTQSTVDASSPRTLSQTSSVSLQVSTPVPEDENMVAALPNDVLKLLLEEAKSEMSHNRSRLSTVQEESEVEYSVTSSWDCMTNGNAPAIIPSLSESIIQDLIKNPRVTSKSLSSSRANSSASLPSNTSLSNHQESFSVTPTCSNTEVYDEESTPVPDPSLGHTDNGKLAESSPRYDISEDTVSGNLNTKQSSEQVASKNTSAVKYDTETISGDNVVVKNSKTPGQNIRNDYVSPRDERNSTSDGRNSRSFSKGRNSRSSSYVRDSRLTPDGLNESLTSDGRDLTSTADEKDLTSTPDRRKDSSSLLVRVKPQAMLSRTDPEASISRAASATSTYRSDSQASTNTVISSSDFEYENQEEMKDNILCKDQQGPIPTPPKTGVPSRTRSTFSPPFF
ncbi:protein phosphatase 1 regulatory subunit 12A-like [Anneissia japonica]|uniref:protein phosphatase 1 regulatory subunit 12A-like n=1 Tax=Anneissia japonica TaxID=1529436 RepID=UPI001425B822|nr:protein phosphatase 1 regulatory subunit 12A-like [Anneissia japonica]